MLKELLITHIKEKYGSDLNISSFIRDTQTFIYVRIADPDETKAFICLDETEIRVQSKLLTKSCTILYADDLLIWKLDHILKLLIGICSAN